MSKFEERKKLLAAESEVYRQLLKLELQTFKVYGVRTKRRLTSARTYMPMIMAALPLMRGFLGGGKKRTKGGGGFSLGRMGSLLMLGWKTYQRFSPMFSRRKTASEARQTAAEEYLSKRL
jgi:hypothetical protein